MSSFKPEVLVQGVWSANALRFGTRDEAASYARDLWTRWTLTTDHRATESADPVTHWYANGVATLKARTETPGGRARTEGSGGAL